MFNFFSLNKEMTDSISLGSFRNAQDKRKQLARYYASLKTGIRLEEDYQEAQDISLRNQKYNIQPVAPLATTDAFSYRQRMDQIDVFLNLMKGIMSEQEAKRYVAIADPNVVRLINTNWTKLEKGIKQEIAGGVDVNSDWFNAYIIKQFSDPKSELSKIKYNMPSSVTSGPLNISGDNATIPTNLINAVRGEETLEELRQSLRAHLKEAYPRVWGELDTIGKKDENKIVTKYVDLEVINPTNRLKKQDIIDIIRFETAKVAPKKTMALNVPASRTTTISGPRFVRTNGGRLFYGKGVDQNKNEKYSKFGKYFIHVPSLKNNILNVKYKSLSVVNCIPRVFIGENFKEFMIDLLENGKLNSKLFSGMTEEDQNSFTILCRKAEVDEALELKSISDKEQKEMDDFLLLKGQVLSGNNNVDVLRQLKKYILSFMKDGKINRHDGFELLSEIAILV